MPINSNAIPLYVPPGTNIHLSHKKPTSFGRFQAVGELSTLLKESEYDLLEAVLPLSKGAQKLFIHIVKHRNESNCCCVKRENKVGTPGYKVVMRFFKEIIKRGLIMNIRKRHHKLVGFTLGVEKLNYQVMLNPNYIKCREQTDAQVYWNTISNHFIKKA
tara:strand:+ start:2377 stop:2856 length:480 start_codon:yes stop_codon:yes gene_type:complete